MQKSKNSGWPSDLYFCSYVCCSGWKQKGDRNCVYIENNIIVSGHESVTLCAMEKGILEGNGKMISGEDKRN